MAGSKLSIFIPINKIDEEQRLVYGEVASETKDNAGEIFDYEGSKPYFQKWSDNAFATSGGKSHGNLRVMHTSKVAGIVSSPLGFNDNDKVISACAKVVDDDEWKKVLTGSYTGFSMGGRYVSRVTKGDEKRYVADPVEISLVDKPCIPTATFDVVKADGSLEQRHFSEDLWVTEEEALEKAQQPRHPKGSSKGGQFADGKGGGPRGPGESNRQAYDRQQAHAYQQNAAKARDEHRAHVAKNPGMSQKEQIDHYRATEKKHDGERFSNYSKGRKEADAADKLERQSAKHKGSDPSGHGTDHKGKAVKDVYGDSLGDRRGQGSGHNSTDGKDPGRTKSFSRNEHPEVSDAHIRSLRSEASTPNENQQRATARLKSLGLPLEAPAKKSDSGDKIMREPTNDEMLPVAQELAKADGKTDADWLDYLPQARLDLIAKFDAENPGDEGGQPDKDDLTKADEAHKDDGCTVENCAKCDAMNKGDNPFAKDKEGEEGDKSKKPNGKGAKGGEKDGVDEEAEDGEAEDKDAKDAAKADVADEYTLGQFWKAKDGTFHARKADAVAVNDALAKAAEADDANPLLKQLRELGQTADSILKGDDSDPKDGSDGDDGSIENTELGKFAAFFDGFAKSEVPEGSLVVFDLNKSMYTVERMASLCRSAASLHISVAREQKREGEASPTVGMIGEALDTLGKTLIAMATEEVAELMAAVAKESEVDNSPYGIPDLYCELSASTLGLEKSDLLGADFGERLAKRTALLPAPAEENELQKVAAAAVAKADKLEGEFTQMTELVKGLSDQLEAIKKMPMGKAPTTSFTKADDRLGPGGAATAEPIDLNKFDQSQLADAAIRLSHQHGTHITIGR